VGQAPVLVGGERVNTTKERIVETTERLFRRQGFHGTGLKQIVAEAGAPFGSLYHFFPGGKEQLGAEVIKSAGLMYQNLVTGVFDVAPDMVQGVRDCFNGAAAVLRETDYADACPIETVALEVASTNETLREACAEVFESWITEATARFSAAGIGRDKARDLAVLVISALEGAFVLARGMKDARHVEIAGELVAAAVEDALRQTRRVRNTTRPRTRR
jgi:AcrR family transcriptional regulator